MKIIVVSDTHGHNEAFLEAALSIEKPDLLIHLGDYVRDAQEIANLLDIEFLTVKGNGDYAARNFNEDELVEINGKKLFLTHGHRHYVSYDRDTLLKKGMELGADIILYGHTHIPLIEKEGNVLIMNPGSPSLPRQWDRKRTFGIITIGDEIQTEIIEIKS